jgi:plasmid stability protein
MSNVVADKTTIGVILDHELRERLEQAAADNERSVGAEVRVALRRHLADHHEQEAPSAIPRP